MLGERLKFLLVLVVTGVLSLMLLSIPRGAATQASAANAYTYQINCFPSPTPSVTNTQMPTAPPTLTPTSTSTGFLGSANDGLTGALYHALIGVCTDTPTPTNTPVPATQQATATNTPTPIFTSAPPVPPSGPQLRIVCNKPQNSADPAQVLASGTLIYQQPYGAVAVNADGSQARAPYNTFVTSAGDAFIGQKGDSWQPIYPPAGFNIGYIPAACVGNPRGQGYVVRDVKDVQSGNQLFLPITIDWLDPNALGTVTIHASHGTITVNAGLAMRPLDGASAVTGANFDTGKYAASEVQPASGLYVVPVEVTGNGSGDVTLRGTGSAINVVLTSMVYQPNPGYTGVDNVVVSANSTKPAFSSTVVVQVVVRSNSGGGSGGSAGSAAAGGAGAFSGPNVTTQSNGPARLFIPNGTVTNGNITVQVLAQNGSFVNSVAQIGSSRLTDLGVIQAVDVFALDSNGNSILHFNNAVKVCLQGTGRLFFLDATGAPRVTVELSPLVENGYSCAFIGNPGTLVLTKK